MLYSGNSRFVDIIYVYVSIHSKRGYTGPAFPGNGRGQH